MDTAEPNKGFNKELTAPIIGLLIKLLSWLLRPSLIKSIKPGWVIGLLVVVVAGNGGKFNVVGNGGKFNVVGNGGNEGKSGNCFATRFMLQEYTNVIKITRFKYFILILFKYAIFYIIMKKR